VIVYNLQCAEGHAFEGWFASSAAYEEQVAAVKLICPVCASTAIEKAPMAPAVSGTKKTVFKADEVKKMRQFITGMRKYVQENAEYVGKEFAEEARKIHYGESDDRHIYGEASLAEAQDLVDEGIDIAALPPELDDKTN